MTRVNVDTVIKIIIVALIAVFLGAVAVNMILPKRAAPQTAQGGQGAPAQGGQNAAGANPTGQGAPAQSGAGQGAAGQSSGGAAAQGARQGGAAAAITVSARTMNPSVIRQTVKLNGDVTSQTSVGIFPDTAGKISSLLKTVGDAVRRDEIIGYIDPSRAGAAYAQSPIRSTVSGTIIALPVAEGETVTASTRIVTVGSLGNLKITIYVAEKYSAYLRRGLAAVITFAAAPDEQFTAFVDSVSPVVNTTNRTIETTLVLSQNDARIKPGMFANVELVIREQTQTFVLPKAAVKNFNSTQVVYTIDEINIARRVQVTTGLSNDTEIEILSGLSFGDTVITAGAVTDGSPVRIVSAIGDAQ